MTETREQASPAEHKPPATAPVMTCHCCGHCCGPYFALYVEEEDEHRWETEGRSDILDRLRWEREHVRWKDRQPFDGDTGEPFSRCFFLEPEEEGKTRCRIHATKPGICRDYPPGSSELCRLFTGRK